MWCCAKEFLQERSAKVQCDGSIDHYPMFLPAPKFDVKSLYSNITLICHSRAVSSKSFVVLSPGESGALEHSIQTTPESILLE